MKWDYYEDNSLKECDNLTEIQQMLTDKLMLQGVSLENIVRWGAFHFICHSCKLIFCRYSGCLKPCTYMRYYETKVWTNWKDMKCKV